MVKPVNILQPFERRLVKEYKAALDAVRAEMMRLQEKYLTTGSLSVKDAAGYARAKELTDNINGELTKLGQRTKAITQELQEESYSAGYYDSLFTIDKGTGFQFGQDKGMFAVINTDAVRRIQENEQFLDAITKLGPRIKASIRTTITQGIIQGKSMPEIAAQVKLDLGAATNNAMRIARTETQRAMNAGALGGTEYAEANGVKVRKRWVSVKDDRTREDHREMDGEHAEEMPDGSEYFRLPDGNYTSAPGQSGIAAQDINCRCTYVNEVEGYEPKNMSVRGDDGRSKVVEYKTYREWAKDRTAERDARGAALDAMMDELK